MSPENKQRLIGIVVLVAFIAILVPFLFTSGLKKHNTTDQVNLEDGKELAVQFADDKSTQQDNNSVEIKDGFDNKQLPAELTGIEPNIRTDKNNQESNTQVATDSPQPIAVAGGVANQDISDQPVPPDAAVNLNVQAVIPDESAVNSETVEKPQVAPKKTVVKKASVSKVKGNKFWSVQVGSFSYNDRVQTLVGKLQSSGFHVYLQKINTSHGPMVRVLVGREKNKAAALKIAEQLKVKLKLNGRVVINKK